jgi:fumarate reductase subunit D
VPELDPWPSDSDEQPSLKAGPRAGLVVNGLLHLVVAWLALRVALGRNERADQTGALQAVAAQPFGRVVLWVATACFATVALWRLHEAVRGHRRVRDEKKRTQKRLFSVGQAIIYTVLTVLAVRQAAGGGAQNVGPGLTARLLSTPFGQAAVIVVGVAVAVTGVVMIVRGWQMKFAEDMELGRASEGLREFVEGLGRIGSMIKGLAVGTIGVLIVIAGVNYEPERAQGLDAALKTTATAPFGAIALGAVAVGLACYGVFAFFDARFHRV